MIKWFRKKEDEEEKLLKCWRRLALMAGTAVSQYTFDSLVNYAKLVKGYVFRGFIEAAKRCDIDDQFLENGELTRQSLLSLTSSHDIYMAYADKWMDIAQELKELRNKWLRERYNYYLGYVNAEAVYALGLAILLAGAKAAGKEIDSKAAETALWLSKFSIGRVVEPWAINTVINLLHPLHDSHRSGWAYLVSNAAIIKATDFIHERLNEIYENIHDLEDWAKAMIAITYVKMASKVGVSANIETHNYDIGTKTYDHNAEIYLNRACSILNEIRDNALKLIASAHLHSYLTVIEKGCLNTDPCGELELISQSLEDLRREYEASNSKAFLDNHPGLMKYLEWHSINPETELGDTIKDAWGLALLGLGHCAWKRGRIEAATDYYRRIVRGLDTSEDWANNLLNLIRRQASIYERALDALRTRRLDNLYDVVKEFNELWNEVPKNVNSTELRASLDVSVHVLGGYLIALALMGRQEYVREILNGYSDLLGMSKPINVATRLTLKYLGMDVEVPSNKDVFEVIKDDVIPDLRPAMAETLGIPISDMQKECERSKFIDSKACIAAYNAVKGDKETEEHVKQKITIELSNSGIPSELLGRTSVRQLIEVIGLTSSFSHFILTLRALILGDKDLALLHAEVAHLITQALYDTAYDRALKWYFDELTDALKSNDDDDIKRAIAKLYYCHLWFGYPVITLSIRLPRRL